MSPEEVVLSSVEACRVMVAEKRRAEGEGEGDKRERRGVLRDRHCSPQSVPFPLEHTLILVEQRDNGSRNLPVRRDVRRCTGQFSEIAPLQVR